MQYTNNKSMKPEKSSNCQSNASRSNSLAKTKQELDELKKTLEALKTKVDNRDIAIKTDSLVSKIVNVGESLTTQELAVNADALIEGVLNAVDAIFLGDVEIQGNFTASLLNVVKLIVDDIDINTADIQSLLVDVIKLKTVLQRNDNNQNVISFPSLTQTDIGDLGNKVNIKGLERPTYNGTETLAFVSELSGEIKKNYKGVIDTIDELPESGVNGDYYIINSLQIGNVTGLGYALYAEGSFSIDLFFELLNYYNKDEINSMMDLELQDDIERETDIIKGNTPVQVVANGCVMKRDDGTADRLATAVNALMLTGPEGMDNINPDTSLDDLFIAGQYSADNELAKLITDKPDGETMAFDLVVGYFSGNKQDIYQLYTSKETQKNYFRIGVNKAFNSWFELAYTNSLVDHAKTADKALEADKAKQAEKAVEAEKAITHIATDITGLDLSIDSLNNDMNVYGNIYTGLGSAWTDGDNLPPKANGAHGFVLEVLPNKSNTVQRYTFNYSKKLYTYIRVYDNKAWSDWQENAYFGLDGYVDKAKTADNLNTGAMLDDSLVATHKDIEPLQTDLGDLQNEVTLGKSAITQLRTDVDTNSGAISKAQQDIDQGRGLIEGLNTGLANVINGTTPVTKVSDTATKGGVEIANYGDDKNFFRDNKDSGTTGLSGWIRIIELEGDTKSSLTNITISHFWNAYASNGVNFTISTYANDGAYIFQSCQAQKNFFADKIRVVIDGDKKYVDIHLRNTNNGFHTIINYFSEETRPKLLKPANATSTGKVLADYDINFAGLAYNGKELATTDGTVEKSKYIDYQLIQESIDPTTFEKDGSFAILEPLNPPDPSYSGWWFFTKYSLGKGSDQAILLAYNASYERVFLKTQYGEWRDWREIATTNNTWDYRGGVEIPSGADLNNYIRLGTYFSDAYADEIANNPCSWGGGTLWVFHPIGSIQYIGQKWMEYEEGITWYRISYNDGVKWEKWHKITATPTKTLSTYNAGITKEI